MSANNEITQIQFNEYMQRKSDRECSKSRVKIIGTWLCVNILGILACSFCCNLCGAIKSVHMTKEDEEDFKKMDTTDQCMTNCSDGCVNGVAPICCCGCCLGACGTFGPSCFANTITQL
jgi:hypothetical protein